MWGGDYETVRLFTSVFRFSFHFGVRVFFYSFIVFFHKCENGFTYFQRSAKPRWLNYFPIKDHGGKLSEIWFDYIYRKYRERKNDSKTILFNWVESKTIQNTNVYQWKLNKQEEVLTSLLKIYTDTESNERFCWNSKSTEHIFSLKFKVNTNSNWAGLWT